MDHNNPTDAVIYTRKSYNIFQDWKSNKGNIKSQMVLVLFRLASFIRSNKILVVLFFWYLLFYRIFVEWFLNIEIQWNATIGKGLRLEHGHGVVIHGDAVIGDFCVIRHLTTIGIIENADGTLSKPPKVGNHVNIGVSVAIIGDIEIGDRVIIGAGSIVVKSVPSDCVTFGNPAKTIKKMQAAESN